MKSTFVSAFRLSLTFALLSSMVCTAFVHTPSRRMESKVHNDSGFRPSSALNSDLFGGLFGGSDSGPKTLVDLPANDVKIGALRFLLQIYLVGEQNKPEPNSWLTRQGDEGDLQIYFKDGTGMISIDLQEYGIKITRNGEKPSLQYVLQESVLLHGVLDELDNVAFGVEDIEEEKRLLRLKDADSIDKARETLPARKEEAS